MRQYSPLALCLALSLAVTVSAADALTVNELIRRLGSEDFQEREKATKLLLERPEALPELRKALDSDDPEVRRRASDLVDRIGQRQAKRGLTKASSLARVGKVDQAIERVVRWAESDPEGMSLEPLRDIAAKLLDEEKRQFGKVRMSNVGKDDPNPLRDFATFKKVGNYRMLHSRLSIVQEKDGVFLIRGAGVTAKKGLCDSFVVSTGDILVTGGPRDGLAKTLLFACGSVILDVQGGDHSLVVVCDGDVTIQDGLGGRFLYGCLIIAGGNVFLPKDVHDTTIIAGGTVKRPKGDRILNTAIRENERNALGLIRFFDPAEAGIEVDADKDAVKVKAAHKGKPFAEAGLRPGDLVTQINGTKTPSLAEFRKRLRAALAEGGPTTTLTVQRSGKTLTIPVAVKD
jgi:hypothetical protein